MLMCTWGAPKIAGKCAGHRAWLMSWTMGWFSRRARAMRKHSKVVVPRTGKRAKALPTARVRAIFSGVMPWVSCATIGSRTRRCQKLRRGESGTLEAGLDTGGNC